MREILFRGKRKDTGEWVTGHYVTSDNDAYIFEQSEVDGGIDIGGWLDACKMTEVIPKTVGQFTGLKDKNGKKIFEGDVFKYCNKFMYSVYWDEDALGFYVSSYKEPRLDVDYLGNFYDNECEILDNIHDNSELL